jgi:hypothetical protein
MLGAGKIQDEPGQLVVTKERNYEKHDVYIKI